MLLRFIHLTCISSLLLNITESYAIVCTKLFIHSLADGTLGQFLVCSYFMNKAATNIQVQVFMGTFVFISHFPQGKTKDFSVVWEVLI